MRQANNFRRFIFHHWLDFWKTVLVNINSGLQFVAVTSVLHWKKKRSHFDLKCWVTDGTKIRPDIQSNWRIFESIWLTISSPFDSNIIQLLEISGRILVPPATQLFRSKWFHFFFQWIGQSYFLWLFNFSYSNERPKKS